MKELLKDSDIIKKSSFFVYNDIKKMRAIQKFKRRGGVRRGKKDNSIYSKSLI